MKIFIKANCILLISALLLNVLVPTVQATVAEEINSNKQTKEATKNNVDIEKSKEETEADKQINSQNEIEDSNNTKDTIQQNNETLTDKDDKTKEADVNTDKKETVEAQEKEQSKNKAIVQKTIEDGLYKIKSDVGSNTYIDVTGGYMFNGANVQLWQNASVRQQEFKITYLNNGYYKIMAMHSGKVLDVANGGMNSGTNVWQYEDNGTDAQQWAIQQTEDGHYNLVSKKNGLCLDISCGRSSNGTNVQVYEKNGTKAQKFTFDKQKTPVPQKTIGDGTYKIRTCLNTNMCIDVNGAGKNNGANVQIWSSGNVNQQKFKITYLNNGYYKIMAVHSGKVLDVANGGRSNSTNVWQYEDNGTDAQQWIIVDLGNGKYSFVSKLNYLYLDIAGGKTNNATNVQMYESNGTNAQKFELYKIEDVKPEKSIENGIYKIKTNLNKNMCLDVNGASLKNGANIQLWSEGEVKQQKFKITYLNNGYYKIMAVHSRKVLDVLNFGTINGTNVQQHSENGSTAQQWIIHKNSDGNYSIISKCNGLYLDVAGGKSSNGTNVQMYEGNGTNAQKFIFEQCEDEDILSLDAGTYRITTALASNKALDITGGSSENKANVQIWSSTTVLQQKFKINYEGKEFYTIEAVNSGKVLEVANGGTSNGTNVWQNTKNGSDKQLWKIKDLGNGYFNIISKCNGLYLDIAGGKSNNGTNVQVYEGNGTNAQKFKFDELYFGIDVSKHNGQINFEQLVNTNQLDFIIARAGWYSESRHSFMIDEQFVKNYKIAKQKGIPVGCYMYSYATSVQESANEANALVNYLRQVGCSFDMPVFLDIEDTKYQGNLSKQTKTDMCLTFGKILKNAGYKVGIYTFKNWLVSQIDVNQLPSDYTIWVASWGKNDGYVPDDIYKYSGNHDIWQYTSVGTFPGISGNVDVNIAYKKIF